MLPGAMRGKLVLGFIVLAALLACKSKTGGTLTVDGAGFEIDECRSGQANVPAFDGVDFLDSSGRRVRFLLQTSGNVQVFFLPSGATTTDMLGESCGTMSMQQQNSEVNGVKNVKGSVSANCTGGGHTVVAAVNFENCH